MSKVAPPGEFEIIGRFFTRPVHRGDVVLGIGDDAAVLEVPAGRRLVAALDTIVEGVHFPAGSTPQSIGHRALAVNLSDLAAMGAEPAWALLSLSLPASDPAWLESFAAGFHDLARQHGVALVGGDTVRGPLVISVQVLGFVERDAVLTRAGAKPGDVVFVSGVPGEAAAGLALIQRGVDGDATAQALKRRFDFPEPRVALGRALRVVASAAMDVSDGLLGDLDKLCVASECGATLDLDRVPRPVAQGPWFDADALEGFALNGGDDYELLFTVAPGRVAEVEALGRQVKVACTAIGHVVAAGEGPRVRCLRNGQEARVTSTSYDHFARSG